MAERAHESALPDRVAGSFRGRCVLLTGGTGFMGKVLVEKLLRKCPDIREIILVMRNKKGKSPQERLSVIFEDQLFETLIKSRGGVDALTEKIRVVHGDMELEDLGISAADRRHIAQHVDIIVHAAATIRFDEKLRKAILLNVRGTKLVLDMAKQCKNLKLFLHISTAYCHLHAALLEERAYPPPADPRRAIATAEMFDEPTVQTIAPKLLKELPNSYAFTKALGEALAVEAMQQLPVVVLRPSIVIPIWKEPLPGWTDNINGPTGLLIGAGKGVIRSMYAHADSYADYLPVDVFVSGIMVVAWNYLQNNDKEKTIYNFTSSAEVKITWSELIDTGKEIILNKVPLNGVVWYPGGSMKHSRWAHRAAALLLHWLPALLVDALLLLLRYPPVLIRVQKRISKGFEVFEYYTTRQWDFRSEHGQRVRARLNAREKEEYKLDANGVDIGAYFESCVWAARRLLLREPDHTLPAARAHLRRMRLLDIVVRALLWLLLLWLVVRLGASVARAAAY